jgi:hypothetical protein
MSASWGAHAPARTDGVVGEGKEPGRRTREVERTFDKRPGDGRRRALLTPAGHVADDPTGSIRGDNHE